MSDFLFVPLRPFFYAALAKRWKVQFRKGLRKFNNVDSKTTYFNENCCIIYIYIYMCVSIVDMIQVGNNTESQLDELLSRKELKWIWDLCSITPYGLNQDDGYYCQNKRCRKR